VNSIVKKLFSCILLFCFLATKFHSHPHIDHTNENTFKYIVDHKNDSDHYLSNECCNCLIKNNKSELFYTFEGLCNLSPILFKDKSEFLLKHGFSFFNIFSRPPPASKS